MTRYDVLAIAFRKHVADMTATWPDVVTGTCTSHVTRHATFPPKCGNERLGVAVVVLDEVW